MRIAKAKLQQIIKEETERLIQDLIQDLENRPAYLKSDPIPEDLRGHGTEWVYDWEMMPDMPKEVYEIDSVELEGEDVVGRPETQTDILGTQQTTRIPTPITTLLGDPEDQPAGGFQIPYTEEYPFREKRRSIDSR
tara:strand:+ start:86 stop:493 length:408 start_codon:yes stop_codon:yes gene_type:complete